MPRILVVEDHSFMRSLISMHLRGAGYEVDAAEDAMAAARLILQSAPDLMVVDVELPHWNGIDFSATVRADSSIPDFPVIVMTAGEAHAQRASRLGLQVLLKPFVKDQFLELIALHLARRDAGPDPIFELSPAAP